MLRMLTPLVHTNGTLVGWQSVAGHSYLLERAREAGAAFSLLQSNIVGQAAVTTFTDDTATNGQAFLYRVRVTK